MFVIVCFYMVLSIDSRRGCKNVQCVSKILVFMVKNKAKTVYLIIYRICKNIYVFCFNFLFFNEMICIFASVIKILLEYGKANYTFLCLFVNRHKSGDSSGCTSDRCRGVCGG